MSINSSISNDPIEQREHRNLHIEESKNKHKIKMIIKVLPHEGTNKKMKNNKDTLKRKEGTIVNRRHGYTNE